MCSARRRIRRRVGLALALPTRLLLILTLLPAGRTAGGRQGRAGTKGDDGMGKASSHISGGDEGACVERDRERDRVSASDGG